MPRLRRARLPGAGASLPALAGVVAATWSRRLAPRPRPQQTREERRRVRILALARPRLVDDRLRARRHDVLVPVTPDRGPDGLGRASDVRLAGAVREVSPQEIADTRRPFDVVVLQRPGFELSRHGPAARRDRRACRVRRAQHPAGGRRRLAAPARGPQRHPDRPRHALQRRDVGQRGRADAGRRARRPRPGPPATPARWRPSRSRATNQCAVPASPAPTSRPGSRARSPCTCTA